MMDEASMQWFTGEWWQFGFLGLIGGALVDGIEIWKVVRTNGGTWPRRYRTPGYLIAELIRLLAGASLATIFGISGQIQGPLGALAIGVTAPLIIEKMVNADVAPELIANSRSSKQRRNRPPVKAAKDRTLPKFAENASAKESVHGDSVPKTEPDQPASDLGAKSTENPTNQS
jgi:hypothetical protein